MRPKAGDCTFFFLMDNMDGRFDLEHEEAEEVKIRFPCLRVFEIGKNGRKLGYRFVIRKSECVISPLMLRAGRAHEKETVEIGDVLQMSGIQCIRGVECTILISMYETRFYRNLGTMM